MGVFDDLDTDFNPKYLDVKHKQPSNKGRPRPKLACKYGHPFVEGSYTITSGKRRCLICRRAGYERAYKKKKGSNEWKL
jgi:hypothetical protein